MITDSYSKMMSDIGMRTMIGGGGGGGVGVGGGGLGGGGDNGIEEELGLMMRERQLRLQKASDRERELSILRSGSAPPHVERSLGAVVGGGGGGGGGAVVDRGGDSLEDEIRSDPAYISYYYSNANMNPRLPPPLLSKEDWRMVQRVQGGGGGAGGGSSVAVGGIGDGRKLSRGNGGGENGSSGGLLFSMQPAFVLPTQAKEENGKEWCGNGLTGLPVTGIGSKKKSFAEIIQDDKSHSSVSTPPSRSASRAFDSLVESSESQFSHLHELAAGDASRAGTSVQGMSSIQNAGSSSSHTYVGVLGDSVPRSGTPDPQLGVNAPSPHIRRVTSTERRNINVPNSFDVVQPDMGHHADLVSALSGMSLSVANSMLDGNKHLRFQGHHEVDEILHMQGDHNAINRHSYLNKSGNSYLHSPSTPTLGSASSPSHYSNIGNLNSSIPNYALGGYAFNPSSPPTLPNRIDGGNLPPLLENIAAAMAMGASGMDSRAFGGGSALGPNSFVAAPELQNLGRVGNRNSGSSPRMRQVDKAHLEYLRSAEFAAAQLAALNDQAVDRDPLASSYMEFLGLHKPYHLGTLLSSQKSQYGLSLLDKSGLVNHGYFENPSFGPGMSYPGSPLGGPFVPNSHVGSGSFLRHNEQKMTFPSGIRNLPGGVMGSWYSESGTNFDDGFVPSFLDEFKNNKTKYFELAEIAGHVVEFSSDQFGSRFIQQKLETASTEEKDMVFNEVMPQALSLMTDVFGNYVIQKFLEHGSPAQIRELADQLIGHVLMLSLQMYGCRVIQKAIEVVESDQKTKMVVELDGHVMRCVRDQNGNHVIQKCIECVPEDDIQFILSTFYEQVVALSTHPYGCRVIQRVLEHCHSPKTQSIMMTEILKSVCMLAQDQYGNYVVQHVLQHGQPHERSAIINKLIVQIVQMSQQKFASNVVEKCLTYGTPEERKTLVSEMLGTTDENEPLQVMMKDQFANYVVQKVLETCDDQQLELILNRIKVHLNALKKYTYGKHIVARVEKLVAAGERRIGVLNSA